MFFEPTNDEAPPSRHLKVTVTYQLEVVDAQALRAAVEAVQGPPPDEVARRLREVPANLVGDLMRGPLPLQDLPGVQRRGSSVSVGDYVPEP